MLSVILLAIAGAVSAGGHGDDGEFRLQSPQIEPGGRVDDAQVYDGFGCTGDNVSPELSWKNPPEGTRSFALMVHDPDAPTGSGWWHWVVWNIPADVATLPSGAGDPEAELMPEGVVQGRTDFGTHGYGGPCPPPGAEPHRYHFRLHALSVDTLDLPADATAAFVGFNVRGNTIATAELKGIYSR